jgi:galactoside O-acetyltransferase
MTSGKDVSMDNPFHRKYYGDDELRDVGFRSLGNNVRIHQDVNLHGIQNIAIGSNVRIDAYVTIIASGPVEIGSYVHVASYSLLSGGEGISLGDFSGLSHGVKIYTRSDDYSGRFLTNPCVPPRYTNVTRGAVTIGRHVIIGAGSIVLPGVTIGEGSSVGAVSLVTKSLPAWQIYFGSPVRKIGQRSRDLLELEQRLLADQAA